MVADHEKTAQVWAENAWDALDTAEKLFVSKKYQHALFFCHLAVEKALKSKYSAIKKDFPPYIHDLKLLASRSGLSFDAQQVKELAEINTFNIAARYDEEKLALHHKATPEYTQKWLKKSKETIQLVLL